MLSKLLSWFGFKSYESKPVVEEISLLDDLAEENNTDEYILQETALIAKIVDIVRVYQKDNKMQPSRIVDVALDPVHKSFTIYLNSFTNEFNPNYELNEKFWIMGFEEYIVTSSVFEDEQYYHRDIPLELPEIV